jgi:hypothetical protein
MSNKKEQTAVDWYISKIKEARNLCDDPIMEMDIRHTLEVLIKKGEQVKEMGKKQMIEFARKVLMEAYATFEGNVETELEIEQYYEQTYGGNK